MKYVLGTAQLAGSYGVVGASIQDHSTKFLQAAENFFSALDSAPSYGDAERLIGESGTHLPVHTKISANADIELSLQGSLLRLKRETAEIVYAHEPDSPLRNGGQALRDIANFRGRYFELLGTSIYSRNALLASLDLPEVQVVQLPANLLWTQTLDAVPNRSDKRPQIFVRSVLAQGLLSASPGGIPSNVARLSPYISRFQEACREIGRGPTECALLWMRDHPKVDALVIGVLSILQMDEIQMLLQRPALTGEERNLFESLEKPDPAWMDPRTW